MRTHKAKDAQAETGVYQDLCVKVRDTQVSRRVCQDVSMCQDVSVV